VEDAPHIDVILAFDVEDEEREARKGPRAEAGNVELVSVSGRTGLGEAPDVIEGRFEGVDERESGLSRSRFHLMGDGFIHILKREKAGNDGFGIHSWTVDSTAFRNPAK